MIVMTPDPPPCQALPLPPPTFAQEPRAEVSYSRDPTLPQLPPEQTSPDLALTLVSLATTT